MTIATIAEARTANVSKTIPSRNAAIANCSDNYGNVLETISAVVESAAGNQKLKINTHVVFHRNPTAAEIPGIAIGDRVLAFVVDSTKTPTMYDYDEYVYTAGGMSRIDRVNVIDVTLTTTQVLALNATAIEVIPAPGAGKAIVIDKVLGFLDYNSAAYNGIAAGEDLTLKYTNSSGVVAATLETTGWLDQTADTYLMAPASSGLVAVNAAVVAHLLTGEIATGNSPVKLRIWYKTVAVNW